MIQGNWMELEHFGVFQGSLGVFFVALWQTATSIIIRCFKYFQAHSILDFTNLYIGEDSPVAVQYTYIYIYILIYLHIYNIYTGYPSNSSMFFSGVSKPPRQVDRFSFL